MNVVDLMLLFVIIYYTVVLANYEDKILMVLSEIGIFILAVLINKSGIFLYLDSFFIKVMFGKTKDIETIFQTIPQFMRSIFYTCILLLMIICCIRIFIFVYRRIRENVEEHRRSEQANEKDL